MHKIRLDCFVQVVWGRWKNGTYVLTRRYFVWCVSVHNWYY